MKKNKAILITVLALLAIITGFTVFFWRIRARIPDNIFSFLDIGTYRVPPSFVEINSANAYYQSFVSNFDNLFIVSIFIPSQNLNSDKELIFSLKSSMDKSQDLVTLKWKFKDIHFKKNNFYIIPPDREETKEGFHFHFEFPPIKNSKNKEFYLYFESPDSKAGEGMRLGFWDNIDSYEGLAKGSLFRDNKPIRGFLAFRTYNTWQGNMKDAIKGIKGRLLLDKSFLIFYMVILLLVIVALLWVSIR